MQNTLTPERLLTIEQVADQLNISPSTVWRFIAMALLPVKRIGRAARVPECALEEFTNKD